jgi:uncharacterized lipoprotein YddW (UPF0748 family)
MRRALAILFVLVSLLQPGAPQARAAGSELRAFWVDAFGEGIYTEAQITKLVAAARAANLNALVVQVGRRGDCFCNRALMPRTEQAGVTPAPFDPLDTLIARAHAEGIQVHAWIIATAIWNRAASMPPMSPDHVFNLHGPSQKDADPTTPDPEYWLSERYDGANRAGSDYLLDPGHPDAADYIVRMYTSVAANYDIDGLNFDRIRFPDQNLGAFPGVSAWGYNPVAVGRFQTLTGRAPNDIPAPSDPEWLAWRREQVTNVVRKVYVETAAIKPHVAISADTITYGYGPVSVPGGWESTRTYREVLQDWRGWMEEGILDLNIPMNYKREHFTTEPNNQRRMYEEWNTFARDHQYARRTAIGAAVYLNFVANSVTQVRKALTPNANGNVAIGWVGYSYRTPDCYTNSSPECQPPRSGDASRAELTRALTQPSEYDATLPPVFATPATVPAMPWKVAPTRGHLAGTVETSAGTALDQILVEVRDPETDALVTSRLTDGLGYVAFVDLVPGRYKVFVPDDARVTGKRVQLVSVAAGGVTRFAITPFAKGEEGRRPAQEATTPFDPMEEDLLPNGER